MSQHHFKNEIGNSQSARSISFFTLLLSIIMLCVSIGSADLIIDSNSALLKSPVTTNVFGELLLDVDSSIFLLAQSSGKNHSCLLSENAKTNSQNQGGYIIDAYTKSIIHNANQEAITAFENDEYHNVLLKKIPLVIYNLNRFQILGWYQSI